MKAIELWRVCHILRNPWYQYQALRSGILKGLSSSMSCRLKDCSGVGGNPIFQGGSTRLTQNIPASRTAILRGDLGADSSAHRDSPKSIVLLAPNFNGYIASRTANLGGTSRAEESAPRFGGRPYVLLAASNRAYFGII